MRRRRRRRAVRPGAGRPEAAAAVTAGDAGRLDWAGLLRAGLVELSLTPAEFWALTPAELRLMLGIDAVAAPLTRARLEELVARFPDRKEGDRTDEQG